MSKATPLKSAEVGASASASGPRQTFSRDCTGGYPGALSLTQPQSHSWNILQLTASPSSPPGVTSGSASKAVSPPVTPRDGLPGAWAVDKHHFYPFSTPPWLHTQRAPF